MDSARAADGVNVALVAVVASVPARALPPAGVTLIVTDEADNKPAKVAPTDEATATPVAFAPGLVDTTLTGVSVVKVAVNGAIAVPPGLEAPTVSVYVVLPANAAEGVNVPDDALVARAPGTAMPPGPVSVTLTEEVLSCPENVTVTDEATGTPVAPDAGVTAATDGAVSIVVVTVVVNTTSTK